MVCGFLLNIVDYFEGKWSGSVGVVVLSGYWFLYFCLFSSCPEKAGRLVLDGNFRTILLYGEWFLFGKWLVLLGDLVKMLGGKI